MGVQHVLEPDPRQELLADPVGHDVSHATDVQQPGDALLDVTIEYIDANSPVAPAVEGRIVRGP